MIHSDVESERSILWFYDSFCDSMIPSQRYALMWMQPITEHVLNITKAAHFETLKIATICQAVLASGMT